MTDVPIPLPRARLADRDTVAAKIIRFTLNAPVHIVLIGTIMMLVACGILAAVCSVHIGPHLENRHAGTIPF